LLCLLLAIVASYAAPLLNADSPDRIPGQYIVVLENEVDVDLFTASVMQTFDLSLNPVNKFLHQYKFFNNQFKGFSAIMADELVEKYLADPAVKWIEADSIVTINQDSCDIQTTTLWNLNRVSERDLSLKGYYDYEPRAGTGVYNYVIDTGIYVEHSDFGGRASWGYMMDNVRIDGNGHGTHVAGTIGGTQYGVAKKTTLIAVKVLSAGGSGSWADVIAGINYVTNDNTRRPATANMSLGGGNTPSVVAAVEASVAAGVTYAIAAGNSNANACNFSPANAPNAIGIAASTSIDARASYSNWGTCVKIFAPGSTITSAWIGNPNAINTISGTSMAAPHVAGAAALILANNPLFTPAQVQALLIEKSSADYITDPRNSPNRLIFTHHCE